MMEGANLAIQMEGNDGLCKTFYALYMVARDSGSTHDEAVKAARALLGIGQ